MIYKIKQLYWRLNALFGYVLLLPIDYMVSKTSNKSIKTLRKKSKQIFINN